MGKIKSLILISLFLMGSRVVFSQQKIDYRFGLIGGVNAGLIKANGIGYNSILWRYNIGISLEQRFSSALALVYQFTYSRQGETVKEEDYTPVSGTIHYRQVLSFDYITLPIMVRFRPKRERVFLEAGGQVGSMVHNYFYHTNAPSQGEPIYHTHQLDAGLTSGLGYRFGNHFVLDARYYYGMRPILRDYTYVDPQTGASSFVHLIKWYNRVVFINLSYYF